MNHIEKAEGRKTDTAPGTDPDQEVCDILCAILRTGLDVHRTVAAQALGRMGDPRAVEALTEALLDEDEDVRTDAAAALVGFKDAKACGQLLENLLGDPCGFVKLSAIDALTAARTAEVIPWLRRMVVSRDAEIVWDDDEFFSSGWDDWADVQARAMAALGALGVEQAVPDIVHALREEDSQDISEQAFKVLAKLGSPGVAALSAFAEDADARFRRRAVVQLAAMGSAEAMPAIARALEDRVGDVRLAAGRALAEKDRRNPLLEMLLLDKVPEVRAEAVRLCGANHPQRLDRMLDDASPDVRIAVLEVLAEAPDVLPAGSVVPRINQMYDGTDEDLAAKAATALAALDGAGCRERLIAAAADQARPASVRLAAAKAVGRMDGEDVTAALVDFLGGDDRPVRFAAMLALVGKAGAEAEWPNPTGDLVLGALRGELVPEPILEEEPTPEEAPESETESESEAAEKTVEDASEPEPESEPEDDEPAAEDSYPTSTLAAIMGDAAAEDAADAYDDEEGANVVLGDEDLEYLSIAQTRAMRKKRVPVVPQVAPHADTRVLAARLLGDLPRAGVAEDLADCLDAADRDLAVAAAESLALLADRGASFSAEIAERLVAALSKPERAIRLAALRTLGALGTVGDAGISMRLIELLGDGDSFVRAGAVRALVRLGAVGPGVKDMLADPDPSVRLVAAEAVGSLGGADVVPTLSDFAIAFEGYHVRETARILRRIDRQGANAHFVGILGDEERKRTWGLAIQALDELNSIQAQGTQEERASQA